MKFNFKVTIWLVVIIMVVASFIVFADTLALFESDGVGFANMDIGKWVIKISDVTISNTQTQTLVVDSFVYEENNNTAPNRIAPGTSAYFDLVVDATECDVAVKYDITFNYDEMDYANNIVFSVQEQGSNNTIRTGENTYSGVIDLNTINNEDVVTLRVTVTWNNVADYDENDTVLGLTRDGRIAIPITVSAIQYLGETITPYQG